MQGREATWADPRRSTPVAAPEKWARSGAAVRVAGACGLGAGIALTGFPPVVSATDVFDIAGHPERVMITPAVLLALGALGLSWLSPLEPRIRVPQVLKLAACLVFLGASLSTLASDDQTATLLSLTIVIVAPALLFWALLRTDLPVATMCASFLVVSLVLLLRADFVFLAEYGVPTADALFEAKFTNEPRDFHYYGLKNPNHTTVFVLVALALCVFWAGEPSLRARARGLLAAAATLLFATTVLLYVRSGIAVAVLLVGAGLVALRPGAKRLIPVAAAVLVLAVLLTLDGSTRDYFSSAFSTERESTGAVRFESIFDGVEALGEEPITGLGLGSYVRRQMNPAHSSIVQAGAEMGLAGLAGVALLLGWLAWFGIGLARRLSWRGLAAGAGIGVGLYGVYTALFGGVNAGVANGLTPIWSLSVAMLLAVALRSLDPPRIGESG